MRIALGQIDVKAGRPKINLETMLGMIKEAKEKKADLIAFPELCISGYLVGDKWNSDSFCRLMMESNEALREASKGIAIAYGNICLDDGLNERVGDKNWHPNEDGRIRRYNAVYVFQDGKEAKRAKEIKLLPAGVQAKTLLPNYRVFDDERYFLSTKDISQDFNVPLEELMQPFLINIDGKEVKVGFEICEDLWCEDYRRNGKPLNPTKMLIDNGAELIVNVSASPWTFGKNGARDRRVDFLRKESGVICSILIC